MDTLYTLKADRANVFSLWRSGQLRRSAMGGEVKGWNAKDWKVKGCNLQPLTCKSFNLPSQCAENAVNIGGFSHARIWSGRTNPGCSPRAFKRAYSSRWAIRRRWFLPTARYTVPRRWQQMCIDFNAAHPASSSKAGSTPRLEQSLFLCSGVLTAESVWEPGNPRGLQRAGRSQ